MDQAHIDAGVRMLRELETFPIDLQKWVQVFTEIRSWIPEYDRPPEPLLPPLDQRIDCSPTSRKHFEHLLALDAVERLVAELRYAYRRHLIRSVQWYYEIEDDPELVAQSKTRIEELHASFRKFYGVPIPPNPFKKKE